MLELRDIHVSFAPPGRRRARPTKAVDGVDLTLTSGESLGLVGESGCGKSTLANVVAGLLVPDEGTIRLADEDFTGRRSRSQLRRVQMVFQDPSTSLDPRMSIRRSLGEVLERRGEKAIADPDSRCEELMESVGLSPSLLGRKPAKLSGGQRQRVSIARALAVEPDVLVADEAVAALDVSVQAGIINLLSRLSDELGLTTLFISHDLSVVRHLCQRVGVMYLGRIVEVAPTEEIFSRPQHPYTEALLASVPRIGEPPAESLLVRGDPPSARDIPPGCRFHPRCPLAEPVCVEQDPRLERHGPTGSVACHLRPGPPPPAERKKR